MIYQRKKGGCYYVDLRWKDYPRVQQSTGTTNRPLAAAFHATVLRLRQQGKRDAIQLIASGQLKLADVHEASLRGEDALRELLRSSVTAPIGDLLDDWFRWLRSPATIAPRTKRRYSDATVNRYDQSWRKILRVLDGGRAAALGQLDNDFLKNLRRQRLEAGADGATVNRDMNTIKSFIRWLAAEKGVHFPALCFPLELESSGKERWLTPREVEALQRALPECWRPLFDLLVRTGLRVSEAQGLVWSDIRLGEGYILVADNHLRRLKTARSRRRVPISDVLAQTIVELSKAVPSEPQCPLFPGPLGEYRRAYRAFKRAIKQAGIPAACIHDLRHTFGVVALIGGVPLPRLQKLMGHSTPAMTLRYAQQAEGHFMEQDARIIDKCLSLPEPVRSSVESDAKTGDAA